jgi:hypothetical protein
MALTSATGRSCPIAALLRVRNSHSDVAERQAFSSTSVTGDRCGWLRPLR